MRTKVMIVLSIIVLVAMNYGIYEKEQIKKHGETLLLELTPADPRSLMQGDYMQFRYAIERNTPVQELALHQKRGYMVISPDENNVAQFVRFHNKGKNLVSGEKLLYFRRQYDIRIIPNSFFFQEGHAQYYQDAKYGLFKFDNSGNYLLVGLADQNRQEIVVKTSIAD
ncbi:MAG: GDYXXLXY domain-containing protein [Wolbachia endosymbiont of Tetragnatha montana]|nr:GDYXXLXY domain-containing protein [Wolbachia endosymbiont of Tetragnatha montana]